MRFREKVRYQQKHERLLVAVLLVSVIALAAVSCGCAEQKGHLVTETYIVQQGDTLWAISEKYMQKNTNGPRDIREFYHGIIEANWEVFKGRYPYAALYAGDQLQINYWVADP